MEKTNTNNNNDEKDPSYRIWLFAAVPVLVIFAFLGGILLRYKTLYEQSTAPGSSSYCSSTWTNILSATYVDPQSVHINERGQVLKGVNINDINILTALAQNGCEMRMALVPLDPKDEVWGTVGECKSISTLANSIFSCSIAEPLKEGPLDVDANAFLPDVVSFVIFKDQIMIYKDRSVINSHNQRVSWPFEDEDNAAPIEWGINLFVRK